MLRDGRYISTDDFKSITVDDIVTRMVGRSLEEKFPERTSKPTDEVIFSVKGLTRAGVFNDVNFELRRGEILGFAGLMGAGRTEVARAIFGADAFDAGTITFEGRELTIKSPQDAIEQGLAYLSEDRKSDGLAIKMSVAANTSLANMDEVSNRFGLIDFKKHDEVAKHYVDLLNVRTPSIKQTVRLLSRR